MWDFPIYCNQPELGVRQSVEGKPAHSQEPRTQAALDQKAQLAFGARHPASVLDPQLPIDAAKMPRPMIDPSLCMLTLKVKARVCCRNGRVD